VDPTRALAHELTAPLIALEIRLQRLREQPDDTAATNACIDEVRSIRRILTSFIELDASDFVCDEHALEPLLERVEARFAPIALERGVRLDFATSRSHARCHPTATERVVSNLVDNAVKFASEGGSVQVSVQDVADEVAVEVRDDGPGVAPDAAERIFQPFYRHDRERPGAGLGLAISKRLAEAQNGTLSVQSTPGQGCVFTLTLARR